MKKDEIVTILKTEIARETGLPLSDIDDNSSFHALGLDSISCVYVLDKLEKKINIDLNPLYFWDYPTVTQLSEFLSSIHPDEQ